MTGRPGPRDALGGVPVETSRTAWRGPLWSVVEERVRLPAGPVDRQYLVHPGAVGVLGLDEADRVLLVHQYRHPVRATLWEPPAGLLDVAGEDPLRTAQRELYEEAHHQATDWAVLVDAYTSPGSSDEAVRIYLARGLSPVTDRDRYAGTHEETDMPVAWVPLDEVVAAVLAGALHNPLLVMGALAAYAARGRGWAALRPADTPWPARPARSTAG